MIPYITVTKKIVEGEDEETTFIKVTHPKTATTEFCIVEVPLTPVQMIMIAQELLKDFDLDRINNG